MTTTEPTTALATILPDTVTDQTLITALVAAHGNVGLAAERLNVDKQAIVDRLPNLPYDELAAGIRSARLLQAFDAYTTLQDVTFKTLADLPASERARFVIQFMDRFEHMLTPPPPVQASGPGGGGGLNINLQNNNFGSPEAREDARAELFKRLSDAANRESQSREPRFVDSVSSDESGGADPAPNDTDGRANLHTVVRLGVDGTARTIRAINSLDDLADDDGSRVGQDPDGRTDGA